MAYEVFLPKLGANMEAGKISHWFVEEGSTVNIGDPLFELVTDKATIEVEAENHGTLRKILVSADKTVPIATTVAIIGEKDEDIEEILKAAKARNERKPLSFEKIEEIKEQLEDLGEPGAATIEIRRMMRLPMVESSGGLKASPKARERARHAGIDLSTIRPSRGEIITIEDVEMQILSSGRPKRCVIIGAGQYSAVIREILELESRIEIAGYVDDRKSLQGKTIDGIKVLGKTDELSDISGKSIGFFIVSVGDPAIREELFRKALKAGLEPISAIHPKACISRNATVEDGAVVEANSVVAVRCKIGKGAFITQNCSVSHDCRIGEFSHLAPGTHMGGTVIVGRGVLLGIGSSISPNVTIGNNAIVAPGSSVDRTVPEGAVLEGCPGRVIGRRTAAAII